MTARIVTIEDIQEIGDLLNMVLAHPDIDVYAADDGLDGIDLVVEVVPDLVILDIMLPGVDGWSVYDTIRADSALGYTPVVVVSVLQLPPERRSQFWDSDIDFYMQKPFDALRMRRLIMGILGRSDLWDLSAGDAAAY